MKEKEIKTFWGGVFAVVAACPAVVAGAAKGLHSVATNNGSFGEGFEQGLDFVMDGAIDIGDEHSGRLTTAAWMIATTLTGKILSDQLPHKPTPPPNK